MPVLVAARTGRNEAAAQRIKALGGRVDFQIDEIDYIRGAIPTARISELLDTADVLDLNVGSYRLSTWDWGMTGPEPLRQRPEPPRSEQSKTTDTKQPLLSARELTAENPYVPTRDIGAPQFVKAHPNFDGRGVTIGILERPGDITHPTLQTARNLDGEVTDKIAAVIDLPDPFPAAPPEIGEPKLADIGLVTFSSTVIAGARSFEEKGKQYVAPAPGKYHVGEVKLLELTAGARQAGVLWDAQRGLVWIDTNLNFSFKDEKPLRDFNESRDTTYVSSEPHGGAPIALFVLINKERQKVRVCDSSAPHRHSTGVASVAAGAGFLGGQATGVAPGARIVYAAGLGNSKGMLIEQLYVLARDPRVDVITAEAGYDISSADDESVFSIAVDRIVERFHKLVLWSAGNFRGTSIQQQWGSANSLRGLSVGGYNSLSTRRAFDLEGTAEDRQDSVSETSVSGPAAIGTLKPDFIAPNWSVYSAPCSDQERRTELVEFQLPPCYLVGRGTSFSAPMAAGAVALLISAAKQMHVPYDDESIRWALTMSARLIPGYGINRQGSGLLRVEEAWKLLQANSRKPAVTLLFASSLESPFSKYLKIPGHGVGLYERTGWKPGASGVRTIKVFRRGGTAEPLRCNVLLLGNDGTFRVPESVDIPLEKVIKIPVQITISRPSIHDAILRLVDASTGLPVGQTALTIMAGAQLDADNDFRTITKADLPAGQEQSIYVDVPEGVSCLKLQLRVSTGNIWIKIDRPSLIKNPLYVDPLTPSRYGAPRSDLPVGLWTHLEANPAPGIWQFQIGNSSLAPVVRARSRARADFSLDVEGLGAEVLSSGVRNLFAPAGDPKVITQTGFLRSVPRAVSVNRPAVDELNVPEGARSLLVTLDAKASPADLYLYNCSTPSGTRPSDTGTGRSPDWWTITPPYECKLWESASASNGVAKILVRWPPSGPWKILVDSPAGSRDQQVTISQIITGLATTPGSIDAWTPVKLLEAIDAKGDREEELSPMNDYSIYPRSSFRPIPIGVNVQTIIPSRPMSPVNGTSNKMEIKQ